MMNEKAYLRGVSAHSQAIELLKELGENIRAVKPSFDLNLSLQLFDAFMQGFLFEVAIADGPFTIDESEYIQMVCNECDLMKVLKASIIRDTGSVPVDISWFAVRRMDLESCKKLSSILERHVRHHAELFVEPYASLGVAMNRDIRSELQDVMTKIMQGLSLVDSDEINDSEALAILRKLYVFKQVWDQVTE